MCRKCNQKKCSCEHKQNKYKYCYDYIIVGAGTGGAALAAKLSDPDSNGKYNNSVLVIEGGDNLSKEEPVNSPVFIRAVQLATDPKYSNTFNPLVNIEQRGFFESAFYSEGRGIGGSSAHNYFLSYRGSPKQYNEWAAMTGDSRWAYDNLLNNVIIPSENYAPNGTVLNPAQRGTSGPNFTTQDPPLNNNVFMQTFATVNNCTYVDDLNDPTLGVIGVGANQNYLTPPSDVTSIRSHTGNSYLTGISSPNSVPPVVIPPIIDENGYGLNGRKLRVITQSTVVKVIFDKCKNAKGVQFFSGNKDTCLLAKAKKEVILCAGTFQNPCILQRSGVGDAKEVLQPLGIDVVYHNPNVGQNMQNHYGAPASLISGDPDLPAFPITRFGIGFIDLSKYFPELTGERISAAVIGNGQLAGSPGTTFVGNGVYTPRSVGSVKIVSVNPFANPLVDLNVYSDDKPGVTDLQKTVAFLKMVPVLAAALGESVLYPPPEVFTDDDTIKAFALANVRFLYHTSGTCRMTSSPADGVIDGKLRVFGVNRLRVADCSSVPVIESGNTGSQARYVGLECARIIQGL